jgi:hypothetical protein
MSWLYSRALVEDCLRQKYLDGAPWLPLSVPNGTQAFSPSGKTMGYWNLSQFGMMCAALTAASGEALLMSYLGGFPVRRSAQRREAGILREKTCGQKCDVSSATLSLGSCSVKTSARTQLTKRATTLTRWVTKPGQFPYPRKTWVLTTFGSGIGFLHTPTTKANYCAASMQKWPVARAFTKVFGRPSPVIHEWMMGWPIGWSDIRPLEMDKFRVWQSLHCFPSLDKQPSMEAA